MFTINRILTGTILAFIGVIVVGILVTTRYTAAQEDVPPVTPEQACINPDEIVFDTFAGGYIRFSDASQDDILLLRNAIPPITDPQYTSSDEDDWLGDQDFVLGYVHNEQTYAYPFKIMNFHEIIDEDFDGEPVLISYCPLCGSGLVFSRELNGEVLEFGNTSALYNSDMVMFDYQTGSYWHQVGGVGIVGEHCEETLTLLPSFSMTWGEWKALYPDTRLLSRDTGYDRPYGRNPFVSYQERLNQGEFAFPVSDNALDNRLPAGTRVLGVEIGQTRRAYVPETLGNAVVNDTLAGEQIVVFSTADEGIAAYFSEGHHFELQNEQFIDAETGSVWDVAGRAISGELTGSTLESVPSRNTFWFALVATYPDIEVYTA